MIIYLIRHAETDSNVLKIIQGTTNTKLNATGHAQAEQLARRLHTLKPSHIYCSDLDRCKETLAHTTDAISDVPETIFTPELRERYMGELQNIPREEVDQLCRSTGKTKLEFGESAQDLRARVRSFWETHVLPKYSDDCLLLCSHGGTLLYLMKELTTTFKFTAPIDLQLTRSVGNTAVTVLDTETMEVTQYGDVSHLQAEDVAESQIENVDV